MSAETENQAQAADANEEVKRSQFGTRFLTNPENVFQHNAWDNVSWDEDKLAEAQKKVEANSSEKAPQEQQEKFEEDADQFWNVFYSQHQNKFFKDRHWLFKEFPELATSLNTQNASCHIAKVKGDLVSTASGASISDGDRTSGNGLTDNNSSNVDVEESSISSELDSSNIDSNTQTDIQKAKVDSSSTSDNQCAVDGIQDESKTPEVKAEDPAGSEVKVEDCGIGGDWQFPGEWGKTRMLEVGCGVGNTVFPILQTNNDPDLFVYCCDFSEVAINLVKDHADYTPRRCHGFVFDVTNEEAALPFPENSLDVVILIFVLSAIHPDKMQSSINRLARCLKPGGMILLRDYGRYDMAQLRFKKGRCLSEHFYARGDGTRVYFFTQDDLRDLFTKAGLEEEQNIVDRRLQVNRGRQLTMYRVWIQCKYRKPAQIS